MKITVYGSGYVGLVAAACFAEVGHDVLNVDPNPERVQVLQQGRIPFVEAGLDALVAKGVASGKLTFSGDPEAAASHGTLHVLAVGTPSSADGSTDESQLISVAHAIGRGARRCDRGRHRRRDRDGCGEVDLMATGASARAATNTRLCGRLFHQDECVAGR